MGFIQSMKYWIGWHVISIAALGPELAERRLMKLHVKYSKEESNMEANLQAVSGQ